MFDNSSFEGHEGVPAFPEAATGLNCMIAVHSVALWLAADGRAIWGYATGDAMFNDVLRLSQAMSCQNAIASIAMGGASNQLLVPEMGEFLRPEAHPLCAGLCDQWRRHHQRRC